MFNRDIFWNRTQLFAPKNLTIVVCAKIDNCVCILFFKMFSFGKIRKIIKNITSVDVGKKENDVLNLI